MFRKLALLSQTIQVATRKKDWRLANLANQSKIRP